MSLISQDNVGVNIDGAAVVADMKERLYPNYLSFSLVMASLCWLCNITAYICIIPAIICSSVVRHLGFNYLYIYAGSFLPIIGQPNYILRGCFIVQVFS